MSKFDKASRSELRAIAEKSKWFHAIDFGDFASSGRFPKGEPQNITLFGAMDLLGSIDLKGCRVLDIGSADGLASFGMKELGAREVVSIDSYDVPTYRIARKLLNVETDYRPNVQIKDAVSELGWKQFDVILCAGVIYHMLNPMSAFIECRKLLKDNGLLIMESPVGAKLKDPVLALNTELDDFMPEPSTYWIPSKSAMTGMMKLMGFDVCATRYLKAPTRLTVLGRAAPPAEIRDRNALLQQVHEIDFCDFEFRWSELAKHAGASDVSYEVDEFHRDITAAGESPAFPFQPQPREDAVGSTRWASAGGNFLQK